MEKKELDWGNLGFDYVPCDYSYVCNFKNGAWEEGGLTADHSDMLECLLLVGSREELKEMEISGKAEEIRKALSDALRRIGWERGKYRVSLSYVE